MFAIFGDLVIVKLKSWMLCDGEYSCYIILLESTFYVDWLVNMRVCSVDLSCVIQEKIEGGT